MRHSGATGVGATRGNVVQAAVATAAPLADQVGNGDGGFRGFRWNVTAGRPPAPQLAHFGWWKGSRDLRRLQQRIPIHQELQKRLRRKIAPEQLHHQRKEQHKAGQQNATSRPSANADYTVYWSMETNDSHSTVCLGWPQAPKISTRTDNG